MRGDNDTFFVFCFFLPQARNRHSRKAASQIACAPLSSAALGACGPDLINAENKVTDQPVRRVPPGAAGSAFDVEWWSESGEKFSKEASRGFSTTSPSPPSRLSAKTDTPHPP